MESIGNTINHFKSISLKEMDSVKLMNRVDTKFICSVKQLPDILNDISDSYKVLEMNKQRMMHYRTQYYDTPDFKMFIAHQNGKLNRYKVREREYMISGLNFLEVKFKNNKRRTLKSRIVKPDDRPDFNNKEIDFLNYKSPFPVDGLELKLFNSFQRISLTNQIERVTIDFNIRFNNGNGSDECLPALAIVEVKQSKFSIKSDIIETLRKYHIHPCGFSKYCIGASLVYPDLKSNRFKPKLLLINKLYT